MQLYTPILIKFSLGILCLILQINLMGKGNLAPSSAMDQVQNYVLGGIIGGVIYNDSINVMQFVLVLIIWTLLVLILKFAKEHNRYIKMIVDGRPVTLIENGKVNVNTCLRNSISANELMFKLRSHGIYEVENVKRAVLEQNGQLTLMAYGDETIRYPIIVDGQANVDVLDILHKDDSWLQEEISKQGFKKITDVYLGEYLSGKLNLFGYENK